MHSNTEAKLACGFLLYVWVDSFLPFQVNVSLTRLNKRRLSFSVMVFLQTESAKLALIAEGELENKIHYITPSIDFQFEPTKKTKEEARAQLGFSNSDFF